MVFDFNNISEITINRDQALVLRTEDCDVPFLGEFTVADRWSKSSVVSLSRYDLDFVVAASAVLAFN